MVYSTDRSKAVVPVLVLLFVCCFVVYSTRRFVVCLSVCHFVLVFLSPFSIAITSLGEERANLSAFRSICACLDLSVSSSSWGLGRAAVPWTFNLPFLLMGNFRQCLTVINPQHDNGGVLSFYAFIVEANLMRYHLELSNLPFA